MVDSAKGNFQVLKISKIRKSSGYSRKNIVATSNKTIIRRTEKQDQFCQAH